MRKIQFKEKHNINFSIPYLYTMDEWIDIVDEQGKSTGKIILKKEAHRLGILHSSVHIWIMDEENRILLQKRHPEKDTFPNLWDISVAGHIGAGESPIETAVREVAEELGLQILAEEYKKIGTFRQCIHHTNAIIDDEFHHIYLLKTSFTLNQLKLQETEVTDAKLVSLAMFRSILADPKSYNFATHDIAYNSFILDYINKL